MQIKITNLQTTYNTNFCTRKKQQHITHFVGRMTSI